MTSRIDSVLSQTKFHLAMLLASSLVIATPFARAATTNAILFVTQVPMPTEVNSRQITGSVVNVSSPFGNHLGDTFACGRGGALWIRYSDGTIANLTALAGYGVASGFQGANSIAVREPHVHWNGTKALFSMVVGAPTSPSDTTQHVWQIYEITNFAVQGQLPTITKVPNQPASYNNVSPTYGTDGRIIFASDRPRDGSQNLYPLREEYLQQPTVTGLWSLNPVTGDLFLMEHSPSGSFHPFVDSFGRVIFTRWDHLSRDVEAVTDRNGISTNNVFNYSDESSSATVTTNTLEVFPEPRPSDTNALVGLNMRGNAFNQFFPWSINEDGSGEEVVNHIGRHELLSQIPSSTFTNDPNIITLNASQRFNTNYVANFFPSHEDPNNPGLIYGIDAIDIGTHTAGQIVTLTTATNVNADVMTVGYITPKATAFPNLNGLYRNPLPLSNGVLVTVYAPGATTNDFNMGTPTAPLSKYDFRLRTMKPSGGTFTPDMFMTPGFTNNVSYYVGGNTITYNGPMWELDPAEVAVRKMPTTQLPSVAPVEAQVFADMGVDLSTFQGYLRTNGLALVVSRNATARDKADKQQPYNLKVAWSGTQTVGSPTGAVYSIGYLQMMQADQLRGFKPDGINPAPGRRILAQPWHDDLDENPPVVGGAPGSVQLGNDGSFAAILPARRAMSWQTTDTNGVPIVRERYWITFQPGEIRTCANCHGINTQDQAGHVAPTNKPEALQTLLQWWKVTNLPQTPGTIVFLTQRDGNNEIYSMNPDGSNQTNLTQNPAIDAIPRVSYDGKKIVFMSDRGHTGNMDVWTMNNDGSGLFNVTKTNLPGATLWGPAMNFDGSKIVYMGPGTNGYNLYTVNADGTGVSNLTNDKGDGSFPYWSYDGSKIVFGSFRDNNNGEEVYIMNANGSGQKRLTFSSGRDFYPVISPDGSRIAFTSERDGHRQIYLMSATDGSGQTNISHNTYNDQNAYFSPDGTKISFTTDRDGNGAAEIYVMNVDGSNPVRLTSNAFLEAYPAWGNTPAASPPPTTFALTVNSGSGSGSYTNGQVVSISANAPPAGQVFDQWTGASVANPLAASTTITMPASNAAVTATYKAAPISTYTLTVYNGSGGGSYTNGTVVPITANSAPTGQVFAYWYGAPVANSNSPTTTLTMPATNTAVGAVYKAVPLPTFTLTVNSGSGSGAYTNGQVVAITANAAPAGQVFSQWTGATVANPTASSTTLTMPGSNTAVTATYLPAPPTTFTLTVNNGSGSGSYTNGQIVSITANAPPAGQVFNQWTGATVASPTSASTTLTMPGANTSVTATYKGTSGSPYDVGPGWPYPTLGSVPWMSLLPGDLVNIHYQPGGYHEIVLLSNSGNATNHIIIRGIADPQTGALPVIDGQNAVTAPGTPFRASIFNILGSIVVSRATGTAYGYIPSYIDIENLHVQNANMKYTLTDVNGVVTNFHQFATAIYVENAQHLAIRNCELNGSGNGFFVNSKNGVPQELSSDVLVERCWIHDNGNPGSYSEHNIYTECNGITFQYNIIGPIALGANGEDIKDRSAGTVIRYNKIIQDNGPGHAIWILQPQGGLGQIDVQPTYPTTYIYGNVIVGGPLGGLVMVRYDAGGDMQHARKGPHYFYNNTVINYANQSTKYYISTLMTPNHSEIAGLGWNEVVDARNNMFVSQPATPGATPTDFALLGSDDGILNLGVNWISPGYHPYRLPYQITNFVGQINGLANLIVGDAQGLNNPHFVDLPGGNYNLANGANAIDAAGALAPQVLPNYNVTMQYLDPRSGTNRVTLGAAMDLGAFESTGTPPPPTFSLTVVSGGGSGSYTNGQIVSISANAAPAGQVFDQWTGATVANPLSASTTITMPASNVTVTATYKAAPIPTYTLTVNSGSGSGTYTNGQVVSIAANAAPAGQVFSQWTGATVTNPTAPSTTLVMPASNTSVTATYVAAPPQTFTLNVYNGSGSGSYTNGTVVPIVANPAPTGQVFNVWYGAAVANSNAASTTLTMPATNITVYATYKAAPIPTYTLTVNSGSGSGSYTNGQVVGITANAPPAGQVFNQWTGATVANPLAASTTLTMPGSNTTVTATYKSTEVPKFTLTVVNGSGSGSYTNNAVVPIVANAPPAGQVFYLWYGAAVANSNASSTTITMPATNTTVYAVYKNLPGTGTVQFSSSSYSVNENGGQILITVTRVNGSNGTIGVSYTTLDQTAKTGLDYNAISGALTWTNGDTSAKGFYVTILPDSLVEGTETFGLLLGSPTGGATIGSPSTATVSILDVAPPPPSTNGVIVFMTTRTGNNEVFSMNPDGTNVKNLTTNAASDAIPKISADGTKIAFASDRGHLNTNDIWVMNVNGSNPVNVTHTNLPGAQVWGPALNANATRIAYMGPSTNSYDIYVANMDGSNAQNLTKGAGGVFPSWSPDGTKIVFGSFRDGGTTEEIYVMNAADGSNVQRLTFATGRDTYPAYSPDGTKIAFTSERDGNREIYLMNADGSGQTNLTQNAATDQMPSFSPDGTKIVFTSSRDGNWELYTMKFDGSGLTRVTTNSAVDVYPSWGGVAGAVQTQAAVTASPTSDTTATDAASAGVNAFPPSFDVGFCPESGAAGKAVTIVGLHFTGVTEVLFNGVPAKFSVKSDQIILTKVPRGATTGPITLVGPGGETTTVEDFVVESKN